MVLVGIFFFTSKGFFINELILLFKSNPLDNLFMLSPSVITPLSFYEESLKICILDLFKFVITSFIVELMFRLQILSSFYQNISQIFLLNLDIDIILSLIFLNYFFDIGFKYYFFLKFF